MLDLLDSELREFAEELLVKIKNLEEKIEELKERNLYLIDQNIQKDEDIDVLQHDIKELKQQLEYYTEDDA